MPVHLKDGRNWGRPFTEEVRASALAKRPYDLRHVAVPNWLKGRDRPGTGGRVGGQSVEVLFRIYAKCLDGGKAELRRRVQAALGHRPEAPKLGRVFAVDSR